MQTQSCRIGEPVIFDASDDEARTGEGNHVELATAAVRLAFDIPVVAQVDKLNRVDRRVGWSITEGADTNQCTASGSQVVEALTFGQTEQACRARGRKEIRRWHARQRNGSRQLVNRCDAE